MTVARAAFALAGAGLALVMAIRLHADTVLPDNRIDIHVIVGDTSGAPVTGLTRDDFDVRVDGQPRQVQTVSPAPALALVLLLDVTMSNRWMKEMYENALEQFVSDLLPGDRVKVGLISRTSALTATTERRQLMRAIRAMLNVPDDERRGPSPIWDATMTAIEALQNEPGHRAVVLLTDGRASGNRVGLRDLAIRAISAGVSISSVSACEERILLGQTRTIAAGIAPGRQLSWLGDMTGGVCVNLPRGRDVKNVVAQNLTAIQRLLRHAYVVEIASRADDGPNPALTVQVIREGLTVHARRGFVSTRLR